MLKSTSLVPHVFAELLPAMPDSDLASLRASLLADGYVGPPIYTFEGKILDGVHRHRLCVELGIDPPVVEYAGADAFRFALNQNLARRHLNASQRAMTAARLVTTEKHRTVRRPGHDAQICASSQPEAATALKVSTRSVQSAQALIATKDTDLIAEVDSGELSVSRALAQTAKRPFELKTGDYEWNTPPEIIEAARSCMGGIDLDPASNETAQELVQAERYYTVEDDGLAQTWNGRVWMNPPYRGGAINRFIERLIASPGVQQAVVITGPYHDTKYGQALAAASNCLCLVAGRIKFLKGTSEREAPPFASVIHGVRVDAARFHAAFSGMGCVWEKLEN